MQLAFEPAYVLHTRPYRDTSLLVDVFTRDCGRLSVVARGVRQRKSPRRQLLNPFGRILLSAQGRGNLKTLTGIEADAPVLALQGLASFSGLYLNELLVRLLPEQDASPSLFEHYQDSLYQLQACTDVEPVLRAFEFNLLADLGYGISFTEQAESGAPIEPQGHYRLVADAGFVPWREGDDERAKISGGHLLAINTGDYADELCRRQAKALTRQLLRPLLGIRPLHSRALFAGTHTQVK
ncbi:DNA repair protein RecO [Marinimicrobium alkaliphilum]|uniref:DNA repair protein RecO n=1 Tax=Marinimicrobium alkaliphilum TaxID=2202654 RepID=UPI000DB961EE|nr:DNA repair protein RecO [Marinimicrobium alkaliphilum]